MKILKVVLACFALIIATFLLVAAFLPGDFTVSRSQTIDAPPAIVFAQVNDLHVWASWSPWAAADPTMKVTYAKQTVGVGASHSWTSEDSGSGTMVVSTSDNPSRIVTDLDFGDMGGGQGEFLFASEGSGTKVTWTMRGDLPYPVGRYFGPMMDGTLGAMFEDGLRRLKTVAEADARSMGGFGKILGQGMQELGKELGKAMEEATIDMGKAVEGALGNP